jgi:hypothetical protein
MSSQFQEVIGGVVWWCKMEQDSEAPSESVVLFVTQEESFDLGISDPHGNPMVIKLWLEIN